MVIRVVVGALADQAVDAVLRPIRSDLAPVTPASRDVGLRAGAAVEARLASTGHVPVGGAVLTPGGDLSASFVIHAVVMAADEPQSRQSVERALRNGLARAADWELGSLAMPPMGLGAGSMDPEEEARGLVEVLSEHVRAGVPPLEIVLVVTSDYERELLERLLDAD